MSQYWVIRQPTERYWTGSAFVHPERKAKRYASRKEAIGDLHTARTSCNKTAIEKGRDCFVSGPWKDDQ